MQVKITEGSRVFEISEATVAEVQQLMGIAPVSKKSVVEATTEALTSAVHKVGGKAKSYRRRATNLAWTKDDIEFIARMAIQLGPDAKAPSQTIATALQGRGNKRTFGTLNAMAYNVYRFLRDGKQAQSMAKSTVTELNQLGYTSGMMRAYTRTNLLGNPEDEVRRIPVEAA